MKRLAVFVIFALVVLSSRAASAGDPAAAQTMFDEAKRLVAEGRWSEACGKFDESQRLDPGIGTLFNLANCLEHVGKVASAWAAFRDVASQARAQGQAPREAVAAERAAALEPKLSRLTIAVAAPAPGLRVDRDGIEVGPGQWGIALPLDPGEHTISAAAPGRTPWRARIAVGADATPLAVTVPALAVEAPKETKEAPKPSPSSSGDARRVAAIAIAGAGVVGVGVGAAFGLISSSKKDDAEAHCRASDNHCDALGVALRDDALGAGTVSTVAFAIGLVAVAAGAVLYLTTPRARASASSVLAWGRW